MWMQTGLLNMILWFTALGLVDSLLARPEGLPHIQLERQGSDGKYSRMLLDCKSYGAAEDGYLCQLTREKNGRAVAAVQLSFEETQLVLADFFAELSGQKELEFEEPEGAKAGPRFRWQVVNGPQRTVGSLTPNQAPERQTLVRALFALEGKLSSTFYQWKGPNE